MLYSQFLFYYHAVFNHQNRIDKYAHDGQLLISFDRPLPYEVKNEMGTIEFSSGNSVKEFPWPSVTYTSKGIHVDYKNRIWVLTFLKQPDESQYSDIEKNMTDCYQFDVFDSNGILQFTVPAPNVIFNNFSLYDERIYLIDYQKESCVYEYRIVD